MNEPRTHRGALTAELLDQLEAVLPRVEALMPQLVDINKTLQSAAASIDAASDRHTAAVTAVNTQAIKGMGEFAARSARQSVVKNMAEHEDVLRALVHDAFNANLLPALRAFNQSVVQASNQPKLSARSTWLAATVTAVMASGLTAACVLFVLRH
jgi:hypothetical protein